jgi:ABC-type multidrug transport system fused ATPase/permease subunit
MKVYLRLLRYLAPYKGVVVLTWIISLAVLALQGISAWVGADFVERFISSHQQNALPDAGMIALSMDRITTKILSRSTPFLSLISGVSVLIGSAFLISAFRVSKTFIFARIIQMILTRIRMELFSQVMQFDLSFSRKSRPGEIASLFVRDVEQLKTAFIDAADRIFMQPLRLIMAVALMLSLSVDLTLLTLLFLLVSSLSVHLAGDRIERLSKQLVERAAKLQGHLIEYLSAVILARSLGQEEHDKDRFYEACRNLAETDIRFALTNSIAPEIIKNLFIFAGGLLLLAGGYKVLVSHSLTGTVLLKMVFIMPILTYPIEALASLYVSARSSIASAKRVFAVLDEKTTFADAPNAQEPDPLISRIELQNIGLTVDNSTILQDISLVIPRGSRVVIFGPSGAGKTSILGIIAGIVRCSSGSAKINGVDIRKLKGASWRRRIGIVPQEPILLNGSIRENLLYACPGANDDLLCHVLSEVSLWDDDPNPRDILKKQVGNRGELLSGGERQRLTIARALLKNPDILLMDEPTSMIDAGNKAKIRDAICAVAGGRTLVLVTHDPYLRDIADIEYHIDSGRLIVAHSRA